MAIREVIRFECDEPECRGLPAMTELEAIAHVEQHLRIARKSQIQELETLWRM